MQLRKFNYLCSADDFSGQYMRSLALVNHIGRVFWPPPTKFRSTCPVDVAFFPFDDQTCILKLGSWLHDGYSVSLLICMPLLNLSITISRLYNVNNLWAVHHNSISSQKDHQESSRGNFELFWMLEKSYLLNRLSFLSSYLRNVSSAPKGNW